MADSIKREVKKSLSCQNRGGNDNKNNGKLKKSPEKPFREKSNYEAATSVGGSEYLCGNPICEMNISSVERDLARARETISRLEMRLNYHSQSKVGFVFITYYI